MPRSRLLITGLLMLAIPAAAEDLRQPVPDAHALTNVRIVTAPGEVIDNGSIVVRDGLIEAVGADIAIPPDARVHDYQRGEDADRISVFPGLIEMHFSLEASGEKDEEAETPPGRHRLIQPDRSVNAAHWDDARTGRLREAGFTTVLAAPAEGLLKGQSVLANTGSGGLTRNLLVTGVAQHADWHARADGRMYPNSLMGAVALLRQTLADARWQRQARAIWSRQPNQPRPEWLEGLDSLAPIFDGDMPLVFAARDTLDTLRILDFAADQGLEPIIVGHGQEYQRIDAIARHPARFIIPVNFPSAPDVRDENDRDVGLEVLRHFKAAPDNPRRLIEAGLPVVFTTHELGSPSDIFGQLAKAIERGLDADLALAALTTSPAEWLGVADLAGRIAPGHMANLIVVEGDLFTDSPSISDVWVDGIRYALAALEPPSIDPAGTWALTLTMGQMGDVDAQLIMRGTAQALSGTLVIMGSEVPFSDMRVSGNRVQGRIDASRFGAAGSITFNLEVDGDQARGGGSGPFGDFRARGRRTGDPDQEQG